jgi:hypothetical protein
MSSIIKIAVIFAMFGKDFTDPSTLLVAIGITVIVSVVEEDTKWRLYRRNSRYYYLWFSDGAGLPTAMIVGTLVDPWLLC